MQAISTKILFNISYVCESVGDFFEAKSLGKDYPVLLNCLIQFKYCSANQDGTQVIHGNVIILHAELPAF